LCGNGSYHQWYASNEAEVTCQRCLAIKKGETIVND